jgi:hypothetical protein
MLRYRAAGRRVPFASVAKHHLQQMAVVLHFADAERVEEATYKPLLVLSD